MIRADLWSRLSGVAVAFAAATPLLVGCHGDRGQQAPPIRGVVAGPSQRAMPLDLHWLVPPAADQDPPLAAPLALDVSPDGRAIYVLELLPPELRVYDAGDGRFLRRLGRDGEGPGEYRHPRSLAVNRDGVAAVLSMNGRLTLWSGGQDHSSLRTIQTASGVASEVLAARGDTFVVKTDVFPPADVSEFRRVTPDTALPEPFFVDDAVPGTEPTSGSFRNHAYAVAATPEGQLLLAPPGPDYLIIRIGSDGERLQTIRRPEVPPLRRSAEEIEELRERVRKGFRSMGRPPPAVIPVPEHRSHIARLAVAPDLTIWALTQRGVEGAAIIDVFSADGEFAASYVVAFSVADLALTSDAIFLLAKSRLDVPGIAAAERPDGMPASVAE